VVVCVSVAVDSVCAPTGDSAVANTQTTDITRTRSTSPFRPSPARAPAAAAAADDDDALKSSSSIDVDPVSVQMALRNFSKQLITAEKDRVSNSWSLLWST